MWPFSKKPRHETLSPETVAAACTDVVQGVVGAASQLNEGEVNAVRDHFLEVLALSVFGCRLGMLCTIRSQKGLADAERAFHERLLAGLVESEVLPAIERNAVGQFLESRLQRYSAVLAIQGDTPSQGDWESTVKDISVLFEQTCRRPTADHQPDAGDAPEVFHLRYVACEILRAAFETSREVLDKAAAPPSE
jgi:hypothetical protein